ncbi:MAG: CcmD family protein [Acidobacteria bacterium]|nr:CcmD family protein [Acidobacteriota bacterium]
MSTLGFLFAGFTVAWAIVFAYVWSLARRSATIEAKLDRLDPPTGGG